MDINLNFEKVLKRADLHTKVDPKTKHYLQLAADHQNCKTIGEFLDRISYQIYTQSAEQDLKGKN